MESWWFIIMLAAIIVVLVGLFLRRQFFMEAGDVGEGGVGAAGSEPDFFDRREDRPS